MRLQPPASCLAGLCTAPPAAPRSALPSCRPLTQQSARAIAGSSSGVKCYCSLALFFPKHTRAQNGQHAPSCVRCQCKRLLRVRSVQRDAPLSGACRAPPPRSPMTWARVPCRRAAHRIRNTHVRLRSVHQHARQEERQRPMVYLLENSGEERKHLLIAYTAAPARVSDQNTSLHHRLGPIGP